MLQISKILRFRGNTMDKISIKSIFFKKLKGLHDVKIEFDKPLTAIMGVNGAGKTTVIHALACIYQPDGNGENHKFPEFFVPNTDALWIGSEFHVVNEIENENKTRTILPSKKYEKAFDRWAPRYDSRPKRNVYYIGIESCLPEIEKNTATSRIQYSSNDRSDKISQKTIELAAYILNKDYASLIDNEYHTKHFIGVSTRSGMKYSSLSMGTGEQRTIKIIEKVLNAEAYSLILIDEIDLLLHVCALNRLIEKLYQIADRRHLQIVFTSHSLEIISMTKFVGLQYIDVISKTDGTLMPVVYNKPSSDIIRNLTGQFLRPINIYVEDEFSQAIVKTIIRKNEISSKIAISKFGAAQNAFTVAAGVSIAGNNMNNMVLVLDGDVYKTEEEKLEQMKNVFSGTETGIEVQRRNALDSIIQYNLPDDMAPEEFMYYLVINSEQDNEITRTARTINAVDDTHKLITSIALQLNESVDSIVSQIVNMIGDTEEWRTYVAPIEAWINERKEA